MDRSTDSATRGTGPVVPPRRTSATMLDDAFDRVSALEYGISNPFVSHAPMACEALAALDREARIGTWADRFESSMEPGVTPVAPAWTRDVEWTDLVGDRRRLPEWLGYFERAIADEGWPAVVGLWVPRFMPGLASALFHGVIRTSHAVRAIEVVDSAPRREELAHALGNWAVWLTPGEPVEPRVGLDDAEETVLGCAAAGADVFAGAPSIVNLHGVTGAMAVHLLSGHLAAGDAATAAAQIEAEHVALYRGVRPTGRGSAPIDRGEGSTWDDGTVEAASESFDPHEIKLVEACRRGFLATGDPAFARAAEMVTSGPR